LAVLAAYFTVALKSAVKLSEPIPPPHTGLSISMPVGNGWHSEQQWMYRENVLILTSIFALRPGKATGWAHCQYHWAAKKAAPEDRFAWKASGVDGEIVETGRTQADGLTIDWVRIERADFLLTTFWGTAELPNGRQLDIEVHQIFSDPELSKRIFNRILDNLSFTDDPLLRAGVEIVTAAKSRGISGDLDIQDQQMLYLIKDSADQPIGFTSETLVDIGGEARLNVQGEGFLYIDGQNSGEQWISFRCSNNMDEFTYGSRIESAEKKSRMEVVLGDTGTLTVRKRGPQSETKKYYPGSAALPDIFFVQIFRWMLDNNRPEIILDLIEAGGKIIPTYISKIETENPEAAYVFDLEFLDGQGFSQRVFLDEQKQIYRSLVQREIEYVFEKAGADDIIREFPEPAQRILKNGRML
jgi:hypothetical protein